MPRERRRSLWGVPLGVLLGVTSGCLLTTSLAGLDTVRDASTGAGDDETGADVRAEVPPLEASAPDDAALDATTTLDAGDDGDGGATDATADGSADAGDSPGFCASQTTVHTLCSDFDDTLTKDGVNGSWTANVVTGGTTEQDPTNFVSPPFGFHSAVGAVPEGDIIHAYLQNTALDVSPHLVQVEFDFRLAFCATSDGIVQFVFVLVEKVPLATAYQFVLNGSGSWALLETQLAQDGGTFANFHNFTAVPPMNDWVHVSMTITVGAQSKAVVKFGATTVLSDTLQPVAPDGPVLTEIGINAIGTVSACDATFDNVTVDYN